MTVPRGARLEQVVASYFQSLGYFVRRGLPLLTPEGTLLTDADVVGIRFDAPFTQTSILCDCKERQRSRLSERIFWSKGVAEFFAFNHAYVAVPNTAVDIARFARSRGVEVLSIDLILDALSKPITGEFKPDYGQADHSLYGDFERRISTITRNDKELRSYWDSIRALLFLVNPYVASNRCIDLLEALGFRLSQGLSKNETLLVETYLAADAIAIFTVLFLRIVSDSVNVPKPSRQRYIVDHLTYGDMDPRSAEDLFQFAQELAVRSGPGSSSSLGTSTNHPSLSPPDYAYSLAGLVERAILQPNIYRALPQVVDFLLFEHALTFGEVQSESLLDQFPDHTTESMKVVRNIFAFLREASHFDMKHIWPKHEQGMPRSRANTGVQVSGPSGQIIQGEGMTQTFEDQSGPRQTNVSDVEHFVPKQEPSHNLLGE